MCSAKPAPATGAAVTLKSLYCTQQRMYCRNCTHCTTLLCNSSGIGSQSRTGERADMQTDRPTYKRTDARTYKRTYRRTSRQKGRQVRQTNQRTKGRTTTGSCAEATNWDSMMVTLLLLMLLLLVLLLLVLVSVRARFETVRISRCEFRNLRRAPSSYRLLD